MPLTSIVLNHVGILDLESQFCVIKFLDLEDHPDLADLCDTPLSDDYSALFLAVPGEVVLDLGWQ